MWWSEIGRRRGGQEPAGGFVPSRVVAELSAGGRRRAALGAAGGSGQAKRRGVERGVGESTWWLVAGSGARVVTGRGFGSWASFEPIRV